MNNIFLKKWIESERSKKNTKPRLPVVPILNISLNKGNRGPSTSVGTGHRSPEKGFAMVEVVVGVAISAVLLSVFAALVTQSAKISRANASELKATLYLREEIEAVKDLEQSNWTTLTNPLCIDPLPCHPAPAGSIWTLDTGEQTLDNATFKRYLSIAAVYRDPTSNEIVATPGVLDPDTKKVTANIAWNNGITDRTMTLETYVYNLP